MVIGSSSIASAVAAMVRMARVAADQRAGGEGAEILRFGQRLLDRSEAGGDRLERLFLAGELEQGERIAPRQACLNAAGNIHAPLNSQIGFRTHANGTPRGIPMGSRAP